MQNKENKKEILENFKTAISSTVKSISNSQKIEVYFGSQDTNSDKDSVKLPEIEDINQRVNFDKIRAIADSKSLTIRFSKHDILKKYEPSGNISKKLYYISEKIRCERIGSDYFKGVKNNIEKFYNKRISELDLKSSEDKIAESFENFLRVKFLDYKNEAQIEKKFKSYKKDLRKQFDQKISELKDFMLNQEKFNSLVADLITKMNLDENFDDDEKKNDENESKDKQSKPQSIDQKAKQKVENNEEMAIESGVPDLENEAEESDKSEDEIELENSSAPDLRKSRDSKFGDLNYKTFTEEFDEIIKAEDLENVEELLRLRKNLDQQLLQLKSFIAKLANKLQRKLLAKQNRSWSFDYFIFS